MCRLRELVMDRREFIGRTAGAVLAVPLTVSAQQPGRVYRLGLLSPGMPPASGTGMAQWLASNLGELGYVEGRNLVVVTRFAEEQADRLPGLARELAQQKPDVIVAIGTSAIQAGKIATTTVPIVFLNNGDPVALGLVASLARPGGNVTGILIAPGGTLAGKKLELLKEMAPRATRIALLTPDDPGAGLKMQVQEVRRSAAAPGVELSVVEVRGGDYAKAFAAIRTTRSTALFVGAHSRLLRDRNKIIELAAIHRLPAVYEWPQHVKDGGLMSYGASDTETYRRVAVYVDRIFKGAAPGELPIEQPSKLLLVINLKTANAMGLSIPQSLLLRADEVIQQSTIGDCSRHSRTYARRGRARSRGSGTGPGRGRPSFAAQGDGSRGQRSHAALAADWTTNTGGPDGQVSLTDPVARSMATSGRGTGIVGCNVRTAADTKHHLSVAHEVANVGHDRAPLFAMAQQARSATGTEEPAAVAERGCFSGLEILDGDQAGMGPLVPKPLTSKRCGSVGTIGPTRCGYVGKPLSLLWARSKPGWARPVS